jgi:predicted nucleic acid-binding protein
LSAVVDASVLMKWFAAEEVSDEADRLRPFAKRLAAPDFLLVELASIAWTKVRRGELDSAQARQVVPCLRRTDLQLLASDQLIEPALDLALELDHPPYDCLYVAAMDVLGASFVTWDKPLHRRLRATRFADRAHLLSDVDRLLADLERDA